jgi:hypothetical protein
MPLDMVNGNGDLTTILIDIVLALNIAITTVTGLRSGFLNSILR